MYFSDYTAASFSAKLVTFLVMCNFPSYDIRQANLCLTIIKKTKKQSLDIKHETLESVQYVPQIQSSWTRNKNVCSARLRVRFAHPIYVVFIKK